MVLSGHSDSTAKSGFTGERILGSSLLSLLGSDPAVAPTQPFGSPVATGHRGKTGHNGKTGHRGNLVTISVQLGEPK